MTGRPRAARAAGFILLACAALAAGCMRQPTEAAKPKLLLLSGLPLLFDEGFSLDQRPAPIVDQLSRTYEVVGIATSAPDELKKGRLLVMAQPRAQTAENLVALDQWVRSGGKLLLFADPRLEWPSDLPLGDLNRPPPMFADTGLLAHWGLRLDAPDEVAPMHIDGPEGPEYYPSPGQLVKTGGGCTVASGGVVARCTLGKGQAVIVADADLLDDRDGAQAPRAGPADQVIRLLASFSRD